MTAIIQDIVSIFFVLLLGFLAGKRNIFDQTQAAGFNKLVLDYCLPAVLFVSIVKSSRQELFADSRLFIAAFAVLIAWYFIALIGARLVFKHDKQEAGLAGLSAGAPTVGFLGIAVLTPIFGGSAAMTVAIMALIVNVLLVPLGMFFVAPAGTKPTAALIKAVKEPVVLAPLIGFVLVLIGVRVPEMIDPPLSLIGHANSGVAVFAAGLVLSAHKFQISLEVIWNSIVKMILMPASMLAVCLLLGVPDAHLEQMVLLAALPPAFTGIVMAGRFQTYINEASSTLIVCVLAFAAAAPGWIALVRYVLAPG
ncbi:MAG: AEC family transporter [Corticimicrobacter sp.]|uniref:AEC family transporter n=1 Tax=Corticimicrobacter sp. TaxID=2678536 RepID=UPI0032DB1D2E